MSTDENTPISAEPTKTFFVEMLTRDIPLEQAVLDLVDNSVDGAKALKGTGDRPFEGLKVQIEFARDKFRILDNCGGFDRETARSYAFRFGKPAGAPRASHSIGQFGVGMKRALFKFGHHFKVHSATTEDEWAVSVNVPEWELQLGWSFPWTSFEASNEISNNTPGTEIVVTELRPEVGAKFSTTLFKNSIISLIKSKHRQFIAQGLSITVNTQHIDATSLYLQIADDKKLQPGVDVFSIEDEAGKEINVRIIVGVGQSSPRDAGWYVICNGRVILEADRRKITGWGVIEEETNALLIPTYHNQFARFRGIVSFDSNDSARVPWNTTKTDIDPDNHIWQKTFARMQEMMRPVIDFLNELDRDIDEHTAQHSPLLSYIGTTKVVRVEDIRNESTFAAPLRGSIVIGPKTTKIQYAKPREQVEFLMKELGVSSAKAVGERSFELIYEQMGGE